MLGSSIEAPAGEASWSSREGLELNTIDSDLILELTRVRREAQRPRARQAFIRTGTSPI